MNVRAVSLPLLLGSLTAQVSWQLLPVNPPNLRSNHAGAYDIARSRLVVHGGDGPAGVNGDTLEFDGATWSVVSASGGPGPRWAAGMAYDAATSSMILFGGAATVSGVPLADTWRWNGSAWAQLTTPSSPPARIAHATSTDLVGGRVVMHGGRDVQNAHLADTWVFDGANWSQLPGNGPSKRCCHALASDAGSGDVLLFGGWDGVSLGETWVLRGTQWTQAAPALAPAARWGHRMAYSLQLGGTVLHGGAEGSAETWLWKRAAWIPLPANGPARLNSLMYEDWQNVRVGVFGGISPSPVAETHVLVGSSPAAWSSLGAGCAGAAGALTLAAAGVPAIGNATVLTAAPVSVLSVLAFGVDDQAPGGIALAAIGAPGCWLYVGLDALVAATPVGQQAQFSLSVPLQPALIGIPVFVQSASLEAAANPLGLITSNALAGTVGW